MSPEQPAELEPLVILVAGASEGGSAFAMRDVPSATTVVGVPAKPLTPR